MKKPLKSLFLFIKALENKKNILELIKIKNIDITQYKIKNVCLGEKKLHEP